MLQTEQRKDKNMPYQTGSWETVYWEWIEAFCKFGFDDGDGMVMTHRVVEAIEELGYKAVSNTWGCHNEVISQVYTTGPGEEDYKETNYWGNANGYMVEDYTVGYDDPRLHLPKDIIDHLNKTFGTCSEWPG